MGFFTCDLVHAEDRYGNGGANLRWAVIGVHRCVENVKDQISRGALPRMKQSEAVDLCIKDYIRQYEESIEISERLIEGITRGTDPYLSYRPERDSRRMVEELRIFFVGPESVGNLR